MAVGGQGPQDKKPVPERNVLGVSYLRLVTILQKMPIFANLTVAQFRAILGACRRQMIRRNELLFAEGEPSKEMVILLQGELSVILAGGAEVSRISPIGMVGEMGLFTGEPRSANVQAATDCMLFTLSRNELNRIFDDDPTLAIQMLRNVVQDLAKKLRANNVMLGELKQLAFPDGDTASLLSDLMNE